MDAAAKTIDYAGLYKTWTMRQSKKRGVLCGCCSGADVETLVSRVYGNHYSLRPEIPVIATDCVLMPLDSTATLCLRKNAAIVSRSESRRSTGFTRDEYKRVGALLHNGWNCTRGDLEFKLDDKLSMGKSIMDQPTSALTVDDLPSLFAMLPIEIQRERAELALAESEREEIRLISERQFNRQFKRKATRPPFQCPQRSKKFQREDMQKPYARVAQLYTISGQQIFKTFKRPQQLQLS